MRSRQTIRMVQKTSLAPAGCNGGRRAAFTIVEMLVVTAIIGVLLSLLLPVIHAAREASRRTTCTNHLRQIGVALQIYHQAKDHFPMGGLEWRTRDQPANRQLAWSVFLLPFLEQQNLYDTLDLQQAFDSPANAAAAATVLPVYVCPSSQRGAQLVEGRGPCDYGGIFGERITGPNDPPKGVMVYDQAFSASDVRDGLSTTLMVAEDSQFSDGQWINGRNLFDQAFAINAAPRFENDIRSEHPGGANAVLADGAVRFLNETMDLQILAALCTRAGGEAIGSF